MKSLKDRPSRYIACTAALSSCYLSVFEMSLGFG
jgi:hypothetical protein